MDQQQTIEYARKFLQDIISFFGENIEVTAAVEDDVIELYVETSDLNSILIGRNAETLRSLQYIVSTALRNKNAELTRVNVDIADYKKQREEKIAEKARGWIEEVRATGDSHVAHINAADRRVVHRVAQEYEDIQTFSEGDGRDRRIIIAQKSS
ncbi:MAG: KH domain-containing protein [Candidatus Saccharibacteria bacterium]|jgi:spoIIIJ-associated protein|nr:KH domain-containing protein [Patescibacteria group bacterium]MCA9336918.1 KH domain-containing protein [Candidatus Saccharibacteria bacterium]MCA9339362.1 KH domain-containing protein [Candidatus Saccharibacteria bacterium]